MNKYEAWNSWKIDEGSIDAYTSVELAQIFHFACMIGYTEKATIYYALVRGVDMNGEPLCKDGDVAADLAKAGHLETLLALEKIGFDLTPHLDNALILAAEFGHRDMTRYLAQRGADGMAQEDAALTHVAQNNRADMLSDMLDYKSYPEAHLLKLALAAVKSQQKDILSTLLDHGLDIHAEEEAILATALSNSYTNSAFLTFLLEKGADPLFRNVGLKTTIRHTLVINTAWVLAQGADPLMLPQASYDAGMANKVLGDRLRTAIDAHTKQAETDASRILWKTAIDSPEYPALLALAIRGHQLRDVIRAIVEKPADERTRYLNSKMLNSPVGHTDVTLQELILRTGQHKNLFDPRLWQGRFGALKTLLDSLPAPLLQEIEKGTLDEIQRYDQAERTRIALKSKKKFYPDPR